MKNKITYLISVIFILTVGFAKAQSNDEALANQYMKNGEFSKAVDIYERLFDRNPVPYFYQNYTKCLLELRDYKKAEKVIKSQIKNDKRRLNYLVDLGNLYLIQNEEGKAKKEFEKAINLITIDHNQIIELANAFKNSNQIDYAITTYQKGKKVLEASYPFAFELAECYSIKGDVELMINEYINVLGLGDAYLTQVQSILMNVVGEDTQNDRNKILRSVLAKRIQAEPDKSIYTELYVWLLTQEKNFEGAMVQLKALDKRRKEDGVRLMSLAQVCNSNGEYEVAAQCYEYVISKGKDNFYYTMAKMELVAMLDKKITGGQYTPLDLQNLEKNYLSTLTEIGKNNSTIGLQKGLAHLYALYLDRVNEAIALLTECIELSQNNPKLQAECKIELADVYVFKNEMWESALLYGQVEKAFKEDVLGQEAKFKNAKLSYFRGEFEWAQAQLDVLKASTSKLIANDALYLSLLIMENSGMDTITTPLQIFSRAELLEYQHKYDAALITLDTINSEYSGHALADDVEFKKASIYTKQNKPEEALKGFLTVADKYAYDLLADDACMKIGDLYNYQFKDKEKAKEYYQRLLLDFPGSLFVVDARRQFRKLRGDSLN